MCHGFLFYVRFSCTSNFSVCMCKRFFACDADYASRGLSCSMAPKQTLLQQALLAGPQAENKRSVDKSSRISCCRKTVKPNAAIQTKMLKGALMSTSRISLATTGLKSELMERIWKILLRQSFTVSGSGMAALGNSVGLLRKGNTPRQTLLKDQTHSLFRTTNSHSGMILWRCSWLSTTEHQTLDTKNSFCLG